MQRVAIIGAGGHGREVAEIVREAEGLLPALFMDDNPRLTGAVVDGLPVSSDWAWLETQKADLAVIVAVGIPAVARRLVQRCRELGLEFARAVSPGARISPAAQLGQGVMIFPGVIVNTGATIGDFSILNLGVTVSHDAAVGSYCNINPGARLAGNVVVEDDCYIGMGANVIQTRRIGQGSVIGAGAVVIRDVEPGVTAVGVPCRVVKRRP